MCLYIKWVFSSIWRQGARYRLLVPSFLSLGTDLLFLTSTLMFELMMLLVLLPPLLLLVLLRNQC